VSGFATGGAHHWLTSAHECVTTLADNRVPEQVALEPAEFLRRVDGPRDGPDAGRALAPHVAFRAQGQCVAKTSLRRILLAGASVIGQQMRACLMAFKRAPAASRGLSSCCAARSSATASSASAGLREQLLFDCASEGTSERDAAGSGDRLPSLRLRRPLAPHSGGVHGRQTSALA
jgi:hypothetical protein